MTAKAAADLLEQLAERNETIPGLPPDLRPQTIEDAYAIQDIVLQQQGVYGWKVGNGEVPGVLRAAPLRGRGRYHSPYSLPVDDWRTMLIEVEVAIVLKDDLSGTCSRSDVVNALGSIHLAYELFRSRFSDRTVMDFPSLLADHLSNAGIVLGEGMPFDPDQTLDTLEIYVKKDHAAFLHTTTGPTLSSVIDQIAWLAVHASNREFPLSKRAVILTGARLGPFPINDCNTIEATSVIGNVSLASRN